MHKTDNTVFPFLLGLVFMVALVVFLFMLDHAAVSSGIYPANSAIALLSFFIF